MTKHTQGTWVVEFQSGNNPYIIADQGKKWNNPVICDLYSDVTPDDSVTVGPWLEVYENALANAHLIAAAPDLLEFAEEVRRTGDTRLASMAIAVINKAKGN